MRSVLIYIFTITFVIFHFPSCKVTPTIDAYKISFSDQHHIRFLDSSEASVNITIDTIAHFFEHIGQLDMEIQMQQSFPANIDREQILRTYRDFLATEVTGFSEAEQHQLGQIFEDIYRINDSLSSLIFPKEIQLLKIHANHYGPNAYYTRQNAILIPKQELTNPNKSTLTNIMMHELFHIYSRYHPDKRKQLYKLIGFSQGGPLSVLAIPDTLKQQILLNPDGINYNQIIQLDQKSNDPVYAIPIIKSKYTELQSPPLPFFQYLDFQLYSIRPPLSRMIQVRIRTDGNSRIQLDNFPDFFTQIGDNTDYIIHPDEVLADNFVFMMRGIENPETLNRFSERGKEIILEMKKIIMDVE